MTLKIFSNLIVKKIDRRRNLNMVFNPTLISDAQWGIETKKIGVRNH